MKWAFFHGEVDPIFPSKLTQSTVNDIWNVLGIENTLKDFHIEPGMTHTIIKSEFDWLDKFVRGDD